MKNDADRKRARRRLKVGVSVRREAGRLVVGLPLDPEREGERMAREVMSEAKNELGLEVGYSSKVR